MQIRHILLLLTFVFLTAATTHGQQSVGRAEDDSAFTPVQQRLTPTGIQVHLPGMRPQAVALSPNGKCLVTSGKTSQLVVLDPDTGKVLQKVPFPAESVTQPPADPSANNLQPDKRGQISYTGLVFSPAGDRLYLSNVNGSIKVFAVDDASTITPSHTIPLPPAKAPKRSAEIPSGITLSNDGNRLYVCGNLSNRILEIDANSNQILRTFDVGVAPYDVKIASGTLVVSNWGGRRPDDSSTIGPAGRGTTVRVDPVRHIASEGSVSIIDLDTETITEIVTGKHASAVAISPDSSYSIVANAADDFLSVISLQQMKVVDKIWARAKPSDLFGASPNAIAIDPDGETMYVANGTQNAIAVIDLDLDDVGESRMTGLIPVGWFPGSVVLDAQRNRLHVANTKGLPVRPRPREKSAGFNTHMYTGSVSLVDIPDDQQLATLTKRATENMSDDRIRDALRPPRDGRPPRPIPQRIGEPSPIKHVVYIIKENRTYDQVFGERKDGNGDPGLCIFGRNVTPNFHKLADEFGLLDNTYCAGILSADGHQWSASAMATDYMEKSFAGFPRSYPDGMLESDVDALAYSPAGFLWDNAVQHGVSIRNYGEFMIPTVRFRDPAKSGSPKFMDCYNAWKNQTGEVLFSCKPGIESVRGFSPDKYVGWNMSVPDGYRADFILNELKTFEKQKEFPSLTIVCLPNDHTSGTSR
ncbi:MAG: beta-propeller fold lactonase family protein, partial [Planctomycetota bacterium]